MIVISHAPYNGILPQPSGPSITPQHIVLAGDSATRVEVEIEDPKVGRAKRVLGRSTSMFHHSVMDASSSSRCSTLTSSVKSSYSTSKLLSTPASTVRSDCTGPNSSSKRKSAVKMEPVVEILAGSHPLSTPSAPPSVISEDSAAIPYEVPRDVLMPTFAKKSTNADRDLARVWDAVAGARRITVICGAGISVSSPANIPDFRSTAGLFRKLKEKHPNAGLTSGKDLFDASLFNSASTSSIFYSMIAELKAMADAASPTTFHHLLKRLDMEGRLQRVYTQNIDGLEERAGLSFGLGQTGDSRATLRALGKRKRGLEKKQGAFARSKSDSAALFTQKQEAQRRLELEEEEKIPMFPRTIPLHGSLSTLTCGVCNHKIYLSLASSGPQSQTHQREHSPGAPKQALAAMDLLSQGESVSCVKCEDYERVRSVAGLRSRGVGIMKVDVVLYNGQNDGAEQVGECVQRDILGLRDPNETSAPESIPEKMARERKKKKERDAEEKKNKSSVLSFSATATATSLDSISKATSADDAFAAAFGEEPEQLESVEAMQWTPPTPVKKQPRAPRLKPLPPDLLIVAGTSLKVPGTKRIVREFAKACHARDRRVYPSSEESSDEDEPRKTRSFSKQKDKADREGVAEGKELDEEEDINTPIRTILLNYDFPVPPSQWEGVFDVWVQGDVQQSALGLWEASKYAMEDCVNNFSMKEDENHQLSLPKLSWSSLIQVLEEERKAASKANGTLREKAISPSITATPPSLTQSKTASKACKSTPVKAKAIKKIDASQSKKTEPFKVALSTTKTKSISTKKEKSNTSVGSKHSKEAGLETFMKPTKATTVKGSNSGVKKGAK